MNRFAKYAWTVLGWSVLVILWGGVVRATGSGAGCGNHWPNCNGEIIPTPGATATVIEFMHRMMSGTDLILIFIMLVWGLRAYPKDNHQRIGIIGSAAFILIEALLGAGLVLFNLVAQNSSAMRAFAVALHLLNTFILLGFLTLNAWWASGGKPLTFKGKGTLLPLITLGLAGIAIIGMSGAITALGDTLFPSTSIAHTFAQQSDPGAHFLIRLRIYHPVMAIFVGVYSLYLARHIYTRFEQKNTRRASLVLSIFLLIQLAAGAVNILLLAPVWMQIIHLFLADMVWISYILCAASIFSTDVEVL